MGLENKDVVFFLSMVGCFTLGYFFFRFLVAIYDMFLSLVAERMAETYHSFNFKNCERSGLYIGKSILINGAECKAIEWSSQVLSHKDGGTCRVRQLYLTTDVEDDLDVPRTKYVRIITSSKPIPKV